MVFRIGLRIGGKDPGYAADLLKVVKLCSLRIKVAISLMAFSGLNSKI
ncbi:MAG: hypothetical protein NDF57_02230 [archaeon GBS-70-058]|nr:hypothetical protein [Candidatus Culexarchaeum nevadense]